MNLKDQLCTLDQAKQFKKYGVLQNYASFYMIVCDNYQGVSETLLLPNEAEMRYQQWSKDPGINGTVKKYAMFTVAELGMMIPHFDNYVEFGGIMSMTERDLSAKDGKPWYCVWHYDSCKEDRGMQRKIIDGETEAIARANALLYLLEYEGLSVQRINEQLMGLKA